MRILIGSLTYPLLNGVTTSINTTLDGFSAAGHELAVVAPEYPIGMIRPEHRLVPASRLSRAVLRSVGKKERTFGYRATGLIRTIVREFAPEAFWLHTLTWLPSAFERVMLGSNKPKVLTYHTLVEQYGRIYGGAAGAAVMRYRSKVVANAMDRIIAPSQMLAKVLIRYGVRRPITVIPTGISVPRSGYRKAELAGRFHFAKATNLLLYVGRVSVEKNIPILLEMTKELNRTGDFTLLLVGPGDLVAIEQSAVKLGIGPKIICAGPLAKEDAQQIYYAADLFVFASQTETQGLVVGEAMLAGLPVVALTSPIQPEVYPEETAAVAKDLSGLIKAVKTLVKSPFSRERLREKGRLFVQEHFSVEQMINQQIAVFEQLIRPTDLEKPPAKTVREWAV